MSAYPDNENPASGERRAMPRAATRRAATFGTTDGGAFAHGIVVNLSPNGLCIRTQHPLTVGDRIEIEVEPNVVSTAEQAMLVRGEVVRVMPSDDGAMDLGVQLRVSLPSDGGATHLANRSQAEALIRQLASELKAPDATAVRADAWSTAAEREVAAVRFRPVPRKIRKSVWLIPVMFFLLLSLGIFFLSDTAKAPAAPGGQGSSQQWQYSFGEDSIPPGRVVRAASIIARVKASGNTPLRLDLSADLLNAGLASAASDLYRDIATSPEASALEQAIASVGMADALATTGDLGAAAAALSAVPTASEDIPEVWQALLEDWNGAIVTGDITPQRMQRRLDINEMIDELATDEDAGIRIEVSTSDYLLRIVEGGRVVATYPVGLGFGDATPLGSFTIANMIENPDWYNRGDVVKAGDPDNPLGDYWMGLGEDGVATSYGIHPTNEPESIGGNESRGCIRMRPGDAAEVFGMCEVGTPVTIGP